MKRMVQCSSGFDVGIKGITFYLWNCPFGCNETILHKHVFSLLFISVCYVKASCIAFQIMSLANYSLQKSLSKDFILLDLLNRFFAFMDLQSVKKLHFVCLLKLELLPIAFLS